MQGIVAIIAAMGVGGIVGLFLRVILRMSPCMQAMIAAATDTPYLVTMLIAAIGTLFGSMTYLAKLLLARTDKAHAELVASLIAAHAETLLSKDAVTAELRARCAEYEARSDRYENLVLRSLDAAREAAQVAHAATEAVKRGGHE